VSEWREEDKRQKRFYKLSPAGRRVVRQLVAEWQGLNASITRILQDE
jgi:PadR family transcriptional regulator PadR